MITVKLTITKYRWRRVNSILIYVGSSGGDVVNLLYYNIVVSKFEIQVLLYVPSDNYLL